MLNELIKRARLEAGLTLDQAAAKMGLSQSTMSRIETGETTITADRLVDLASAYGVSPSQLLDGAVVRSMSQTDLDRIGAVIEFVEIIAEDQTPRPSPQKIRDTVLAIFRQETSSAWETGAAFDPSRYSELVTMLLSAK
ncbi:helix-turn-helix domain-containing protein [Tritonibacter mobilis]|uniref:helix-turn-helix domain-containing protein n=1 Tax=Tritonibacter mobilis TaxID=379347 RepID=UPI0039A586F8